MEFAVAVAAAVSAGNKVLRWKKWQSERASGTRPVGGEGVATERRRKRLPA